MKILLIALLILAIVLQSGVFSIPLALGFLVMMWILYQELWIVITAFIAGLVVDIINFHALGVSSIFFLVTLFLIQLYQRKFEIQSVPFVGVSVFVFSLLYGALFIKQFSLFAALITASVVTIVYLLAMIGRRSKNSLVFSS